MTTFKITQIQRPGFFARLVGRPGKETDLGMVVEQTPLPIIVENATIGTAQIINGILELELPSPVQQLPIIENHPGVTGTGHLVHESTGEIYAANNFTATKNFLAVRTHDLKYRIVFQRIVE